MRCDIVEKLPFSGRYLLGIGRTGSEGSVRSTSHWSIVDHDLKIIEISIHQKRKYDQEHFDRFILAYDRLKSLLTNGGSEAKENKRLVRKFQSEVNPELLREPDGVQMRCSVPGPKKLIISMRAVWLLSIIKYDIIA